VARLKPETREQQTRLAMLLQERGPRVTEIARQLDESPETVRYWFKHNILGGRGGIAYQAVPDYGGLGFRRIHAIIDFSDEYLPHAKDVLISMSRLCYLSYCFRIFPSGYYSITLTVPSEVVHHYSELLQELQDTGIFRIVESGSLDWVHVTPMKARYFDFNKGRWDFDWSAMANEKTRAIPINQSNSVEYDYEDLRILEKLQVDATKSLGEISRELKIPYQNAYNHFSHIIERKQISLYRIVWPATGPKNQEESKAWQQHHAHMAIQFLVRNASKSESLNLLNKMERLPFNWANGGGEGSFLSEFVVPLEYYSETFQYLAETLQDSRRRTEFFIANQADALSFTIPTHLYNRDANAWSNSADEALARFKKLVVPVKGR
jgi:hypothetical protein